MDGGTRATWMLALVCALMIFGIFGVPLMTGGAGMGPIGGIFIPFFFCLPLAFSFATKELREARADVRNLRTRIEELERAASAGARPAT